MTNNEQVYARLGWLEQALHQLAEKNNFLNARTLAEQYVARYFDDFGPVSHIIWQDYNLPE